MRARSARVSNGVTGFPMAASSSGSSPATLSAGPQMSRRMVTTGNGEGST